MKYRILGKSGLRVSELCLGAMTFGEELGTGASAAVSRQIYDRYREMDEEEAVALVVNGFCKDVLQALPMEFAMEAQQLVAISLEGSVG